MSALKIHIKDDMKVAMRAKDKKRLTVIRMILAAIKQIEVDEQIELDDVRIIVVLDKMLKQRRESIKQFKQAGRADLTDLEEAEAIIIQAYLPKALSEDEINTLLEKAIAECSAKSIKDMGKVMGILKPQMVGRVNMAVISQHIKMRLAL